jgi:hypothetical protein
MNRQHAGIILNRLIGMRWERYEGGRYGLLETA